MNRFMLAPLVTVLLSPIIGCGGVAPNTAVVSTQEVARGDYCHKKLPAVGPSNPTMVAALTRGYHRLLWSLRRPIGQRANPATKTF